MAYVHFSFQFGPQHEVVKEDAKHGDVICLLIWAPFPAIHYKSSVASLLPGGSC